MMRAVLCLLGLLAASQAARAEVSVAAPARADEITKAQGNQVDFAAGTGWVRWSAQDFKAADLTAFDMTDPEAWRAEEDGGAGVLALYTQSKYQPGVRSPVNMARVKDLILGDCVLDADVRMTAPQVHGRVDLCFFFGYQDPSHFYYAHLAVTPDPNHHGIFLVNGTPRAPIATYRNDGITWGPDYHHVRVVRETQSGRIRVYFDDMSKPVLEAKDTTLTWGQVGVGSFDDTGNFKRLTVYGNPVPASKSAAK